MALTLGISQGVEFRKKIPSSSPFSQFPLTVGAWEGTRQYMEQKFITELDLSDYTMIDFKSDGKHVDFYVAYYESQRKGESIHSPETCLPGSGGLDFPTGRSCDCTASGSRQIDDGEKGLHGKDLQRQADSVWKSTNGFLSYLKRSLAEPNN